MPNGKTHTKINVILLFVILLSLHTKFMQTYIPPEYLEFDATTIFSLALIFGTYYLSPDLDIQSEPFKRWGILRYIQTSWKTASPVVGPNHNYFYSRTAHHSTNCHIIQFQHHMRPNKIYYFITNRNHHFY